MDNLPVPVSACEQNTEWRSPSTEEEGVRWLLSTQPLLRLLLIGLVIAAVLLPFRGTLAASVVRRGENGKLGYSVDELGNRVPDFSHCGYAGGNEVIPFVGVRVVVRPAVGDDGARIQAAIDYVSALAPDGNGFRGAVLLAPGRFEVEGQLTIRASGVVLRGSGMVGDGTVLHASGRARRTLIRVLGRDDRKVEPTTTFEVASEYVPVGAISLKLKSAAGLEAGDSVLVTRPSTEEWIRALGMDRVEPRWKPGTRDIKWDRVVTAVDGNTVTLDAPITTAIETRYGGGRVERFTWPGRIERVGVENLRLESAFEAKNPLDESHSWVAITMENVQNSWVRRVEFTHFAGSAVSLWESAKWITVADCRSLDPVSELGGYRRQTFFTTGQMTLFLRCWSEHGRRDFTVGDCAPGPNAFVACSAREAFGDSGPIGSWASGVLYDNVRIDRGGLNLLNRYHANQGAGWSAANCVLWQSTASEMRCFAPPTAENWAIGVWSTFIGDAHWESQNAFVNPRSLYLRQLADRLGERHAESMGPIVRYPPGSTSPSIQQASDMVSASNTPAPELKGLIDSQSDSKPIAIDQTQAPALEEVAGTPQTNPRHEVTHKLKLKNGWLVVNGKLKTGGRMEPIWWRGSVRPSEAPGYGAAITRFVPGRIGKGYTDDLDEVTREMVRTNTAVMDHHYGLWYDRRRDDHERVRRLDGDVSPPFYELPFARSGTGTAWDGLSRYDLSKYNPWYWSRLSEFACLCDQKGLVLIHQNYFQHNILEAGAHWADFPWRTANNINDTGFPEPPPYAGDKRIFQAHLFYDVTHPVRRKLHRAYIRKCLDNFVGRSNVIQMTSAEFTGPSHFVEFWIDTIIEWEEETGDDVLIALSSTKDVQDRILTDPIRSTRVSIIDIRYWWYQATGELYAPGGGKNLSPRQHARQLRPKRSSFEQTVRAVREYRVKFPDKVVLYNANGAGNPWAVLMGGGSLPNLPKFDEQLLAALPRMLPQDRIVASGDGWCLAEPDGAGYLIYSTTSRAFTIDLSETAGTYLVRWVQLQTGAITDSNTLTGRRRVELRPPREDTPVVWLTRQ